MGLEVPQLLAERRVPPAALDWSVHVPLAVAHTALWWKRGSPDLGAAPRVVAGRQRPARVFADPRGYPGMDSSRGGPMWARARGLTQPMVTWRVETGSKHIL